MLIKATKPHRRTAAPAATRWDQGARSASPRRGAYDPAEDRRADDFGMMSDRPFVPVGVAVAGGFAFRRTPLPFAQIREIRRTGARDGQSPRNAFRPHHSVSTISKIR